MKRRNSESSTIYEKRPRRTYSLEEKMEIIQLSEQGERNCDIARAFGIRESTLRTICAQADKIKAAYQKSSAPSSTEEVPQVRTNLMDDMENQLVLWINEQIDNNLKVDTEMVREKAVRIYNVMKIGNNGVSGRPFVASDGWLERFKKRVNFDNLTKDNHQTINEFPAILNKIIIEDGYQSKQVFCIDETELYWKQIPCDPSMDVDQQEIVKDRLALMFCMNASGDYRLKPLVVYHIANPKVLDGYSKNHLPVVWRSHPQARITTNIFIDYFCNRLTNELKDYCAREDIPFKILLILSHTSSIHSSYLMDLSENIKVVCLPFSHNHTTVHPLKQGVISVFKANYIRHVYLKLLESVDDDELDLTGFWENFTIKNAIDLISAAWSDISVAYLNKSWQHLWPDCVHDYKVFDLIDDLQETKTQLSTLSNEIGFKNIEIDAFIDDNLSNTNCGNDNQQNVKEHKVAQIRTLTIDILNQAFNSIQNAINIFDEYDPDRERSTRIIRSLENSILCYKQIYNEKKRAVKQLTTNSSTQLPVSHVIKVEEN